MDKTFLFAKTFKKYATYKGYFAQRLHIFPKFHSILPLFIKFLC